MFFQHPGIHACAPALSLPPNLIISIFSKGRSGRGGAPMGVPIDNSHVLTTWKGSVSVVTGQPLAFLLIPWWASLPFVGLSCFPERYGATPPMWLWLLALLGKRSHPLLWLSRSRPWLWQPPAQTESRGPGVPIPHGRGYAPLLDWRWCDMSFPLGPLCGARSDCPAREPFSYLRGQLEISPRVCRLGGLLVYGQ